MNVLIREHAKAILLMAAIALPLTACSDSTNVIGPVNQAEVTNQIDTFEWQVTALDNVSQTLTYTWETTGTVINVNQSSSSIDGGTAMLSIVDIDGDEVYYRSLIDDSGTFQTGTGTSGVWTVTITLSGVTGGLNFRLEKP
jgi:hypothetical protein